MNRNFRYLLPAIMLIFFLTGYFLLPKQGRGATESQSLDGIWKITIDPNNKGRQNKWWSQELAGAKDIPVPGIIQQVHSDYHGVVWYSRSFITPKNGHQNGRFILRFMQSYYFTEVWINNRYIGSHEGGEDYFKFDVTEALAPTGKENRLVVRVIDPRDESIEQFSTGTIPKRNGTNQITAGCGANCGGIMDHVDLLITPCIYIDDLHVIPDPKTGTITARLKIQNNDKQEIHGQLEFSVTSDLGGEILARSSSPDVKLVVGPNSVTTEIRVPDFKLWDINAPNLYYASVCWKNSKPALPDGEGDVKTTRCGFRDFRFENGAFRLNGRRIYIKCSHSGSDGPITYRMPFQPDLFLKDIINCKTMGFNMIRYISGMPRTDQIDLCDSIGLLVYDECYAGWCLGESPQRTKRFQDATSGMILRDRNHPSVVCWGLLNETSYVPTLIDAFNFLRTAQELGPGRIVFYNSGSFDPFSANSFGKADYSCWRTPRTITPSAVYNPLDHDFFHDGTRWKAKSFMLHPGDMTFEYSGVCWTAPKQDLYQLNVRFFDCVEHGKATVDLHIYKNRKEILFESFLNLHDQKNEVTFSKSLKFNANDKLDVVVGIGDGQGTGDTTGVDLKITDTQGKVYDVAQEYSATANPNGVWSYGFIPQGPKPDLTQWTLYPLGQEKLSFEPIGRLANPGSMVWQNLLADTHPYQQTPHRAPIIRKLRDHAVADLPVFLSEYGVGSGVNLVRLTRFYELYNATSSMDAIYYRDKLDKFMVDWKNWKLEEAFSSPEAYFDDVLAWMAEQRRYGINAIRANSHIIAHSVTGTHDQGHSGEGLTTTFRELKSGTTDIMAELFAPLRFSLFVEPVQLYRGDKIKLEAVLVNEDILPPGTWPVRYIVTGPNNTRIFDKTTKLTVPNPPKGKENPFSLPVFSEEFIANGPSGEYTFRAILLQKGPATGVERFFIADRKDMPVCNTPCIVCGNDSDLIERLNKVGIKMIRFEDAKFTDSTDWSKQILIVGQNVQNKNTSAFQAIYDLVRKGATVIFLSPNVFSDGKKTTAFLPFEEQQKGDVKNIGTWLYHKDDWNKYHPYFNGLPTGTVMDHLYYREILPDVGYCNLPIPGEAVSGAFNTSFNYSSCLNLAIYRHGKGKIVLNTFRIQNNLGTDPTAERLLRNMLNTK